MNEATQSTDLVQAPFSWERRTYQPCDDAHPDRIFPEQEEFLLIDTATGDVLVCVHQQARNCWLAEWVDSGTCTTHPTSAKAREAGLALARKAVAS